MAKKDKNDRSDEIRVVGNAEAPDDEVVRLDAPKRVTIERKEAASEDRAMPHMMGDAREVQEAREEAIDPETAWLRAAGKSEVKAIPVGWFVLLGAAIVGVIFWVAAQNASAPGRGSAGAGIPELEGAAAVPLGKMEELEEIEKAKAHYDAMEIVVSKFLAAKSIEERAQYVRDADRVRPLMRDHYQRRPWDEFQYKETLEYHVVTLENFPFIALNVGLEGGGAMPVLIEDRPGGLVVDWESFVCYQPVDLERFAEERIEEPVELRAYVQRDQFYAYEFADESKFSCYRLTFRNSEVDLFGYVERGTKLEEEFRKLFPDDSSLGLQKPLILSLSFLPGSRAPKSVKISELHSRLWAYAPGAAEAGAKSGSE